MDEEEFPNLLGNVLAHQSLTLTSHKHLILFEISTLPYPFKASFEQHHAQSVQKNIPNIATTYLVCTSKAIRSAIRAEKTSMSGRSDLKP